MYSIYLATVNLMISIIKIKIKYYDWFEYSKLKNVMCSSNILGEWLIYRLVWMDTIK